MHLEADRLDWLESVSNGILEYARQPEFQRLELAEPHPIFAEPEPSHTDALNAMRRAFTWVGDELTAVRFTLDAEGSVTSTNQLQKSLLVKVRKKA